MWYPVKTAAIFRFLFPKLFWKIPDNNTPVLYLTFDDGPIPEITPWVLDLLKKFNAKATFFCIGRNVERNKEIYDRILNEGHGTGNHTYNHLNGWKTEKSEYINNTELCAQLVTSDLFRPPYGKMTFGQLRTLKKMGYRIVMWDVIAGDFDPDMTAEKCLKNVLHYSENGTILVLHDSIKAFPRLQIVLPALLEHFSSKGFEFKKLT